jgi:hypothetical protein
MLSPPNPESGEPAPVSSATYGAVFFNPNIKMRHAVVTHRLNRVKYETTKICGLNTEETGQGSKASEADLQKKQVREIRPVKQICRRNRSGK